MFFFFNDTATTEIYTLSLHDALPISFARGAEAHRRASLWFQKRQTKKIYGCLALGNPALPILKIQNPIEGANPELELDRKSTRLNSSHQIISYAVFCLKKKKDATHVK